MTLLTIGIYVAEGGGSLYKKSFGEGSMELYIALFPVNIWRGTPVFLGTQLTTVCLDPIMIILVLLQYLIVTDFDI